MDFPVSSTLAHDQRSRPQSSMVTGLSSGDAVSSIVSTPHQCQDRLHPASCPDRGNKRTHSALEEESMFKLEARYI